jgi:hypothetical protein
MTQKRDVELASMIFRVHYPPLFGVMAVAHKLLASHKKAGTAS